jgi:tyrosyl-tRNA synthetase
MNDEKFNPRDAKLRLAGEIVEIYHGEENARMAREYFINTFSKKEIPQNIEIKIIENISVIDKVLVDVNFAESKSDAGRKIEQGGVSIDGEKITDKKFVLKKELHDGKILKVGKKDFVKIKF